MFFQAEKIRVKSKTGNPTRLPANSIALGDTSGSQPILKMPSPASHNNATKSGNM